MFLLVSILVRARLIRPRLDSFRLSRRFLSGVIFLSRASAILAALRRMVMRRRAVRVFFIFLSFTWVLVVLPLYLPVGLWVCLCLLCFQVLGHGAIVPTLFGRC